MGKLRIHNLNHNIREAGLEEISLALDKAERHIVERIPWPQFSYKPRVSFSIAYDQNVILLKYFVQENFIRMECYSDNGPVYQDSCVEFFIAFDDEEGYYNLEFNCTGACMVGFGGGRIDRKLIDERLLRNIRRLSVIKSLRDHGRQFFNWELTLVIPSEIFAYSNIENLKERHCRANFYKCGDKLPEPHFLAWKNVEAATPDFHLPEFFGTVYFT